jgi:hypothetical protein
MEGQIRSCRCEEENRTVQKVGGALIQHEEEMQWEAAFSVVYSQKTNVEEW